jgi:hypothetical protein
MGGYLEKLKMKKRVPQALPKLPKGKNTPTHGTAKTAKSPFDSKDSKGGRHISEKKQNTQPDPGGLTQPPADSTPEYRELWNRAWILADWIDNPEAAPLADRKARLPELIRMRDRLAELEQVRT